jgi:hypothetical protein
MFQSSEVSAPVSRSRYSFLHVVALPTEIRNLTYAKLVPTVSVRKVEVVDVMTLRFSASLTFDEPTYDNSCPV